MQRTAWLLTLLALSGGHPAAAQPAGGLTIELNIPALRIVVRDGEEVLRRYPVSVGQLGHDTPEGRFTISRAEWNPSWRPPQSEWARGKKYTPPGPTNPMGRVKLFFMPLYYIHGTPDAESLGTPASHGCVRMRNDDVVELATLIHRRAGATLPSEKIPAVLADSRRTRVSQLQDSVTFLVHYTPVMVEDGELVVYPDIYQRRLVHAEAVYQALLAAGYDVRGVEPARVKELLQRARRQKGALRVAVADAFGAQVAATAGRGSGREGAAAP